MGIKSRIAIVMLAFSIHAYTHNISFAQEMRLDMSGQWMFRLDRDDQGVNERWFDNDFDQHINLPGSLQNQGYGDDITKDTEWVTDEGKNTLWYTHPMYSRYREKDNLRFPNNFQPKKHYVGVAWYRKKVSVPKNCKGKTIFLHLERVHWESTLWIDDIMIGKSNSLLAPHVYDLTKYLKPGKEHDITLRVDNREIVKVGAKGHSWGDQTMTAWNGVIGNMCLVVKDPVHIADLQIFPDVDAHKARFRYTFRNDTPKDQDIEVAVKITSYNTEISHNVNPEPFTVTIAPGISEYTREIDMTGSMLLWSEYEPNLYMADIEMRQGEKFQHFKQSFGMRNIQAKDNRFILNGQEIYIRGSVNCGCFPETGYTATDIQTWKRIMMIYKYYGLNHIRFHSWTPPEAAFQAADEVGLYLYAETDTWTHINTLQQEEFLAQEGARALKFYGNHPSFLLMGMGNETSARKDITDRLLTQWKKDDRRLYTTMANSPHSLTPECEFTATREVRPNLGWPPAPERTLFYVEEPSTDFTYGDPVKYSIPLITHEAGQQCSYPALDQMMKFTGSQFAGYIDIARDQLNERGMLWQWPDFVKASGKLQTIFYKHELEAYLRMPRHTGYELLQLEDFQGQGGGLDGVLDYFYDSKGYITAQEFRTFCGPEVMLLMMPKMTWTHDETFRAEAMFSNWSESDITNARMHYRIISDQGYVYKEMTYSPTVIPRGDAVSLGVLELDLNIVDTPCRLTVEARMEDSDMTNEWAFWVYPASAPAHKEISIARVWNDSIAKRICSGENMIIQLDRGQLKRGCELPSSFLPIFWSQLDKMGSAQTMGILCNPEHEIFRHFPTSYHTDWQWHALLKEAYPIVFDENGMADAWDKTHIPLIQLIDGWKTNRKMGVLTEARLGKGKFIITSINLTDNLDDRISARQFRYSLMNYMNSGKFQPTTTVTTSQVAALLNLEGTEKEKSPIMGILFANIRNDKDILKLIDGYADTGWSSRLEEESSMTLVLKQKEYVGGLTCLRAGDNRKWQKTGYRIYLSGDGENWGLPIAQGDLSQTKGRTDVSFEYFHGARYIRIEWIPTVSEAELSLYEIGVLTQ